MKYGRIVLAIPLMLGFAITLGDVTPAAAADQKMEKTAPKNDWRAKLGGAYTPSDKSEEKAKDEAMEMKEDASKIEPAAGPAMDDKMKEMKK